MQSIHLLGVLAAAPRSSRDRVMRVLATLKRLERAGVRVEPLRFLSPRQGRPMRAAPRRAPVASRPACITPR